LDDGMIADLSEAKANASGILSLKLNGSDSIAACDGAGKTTYRLSGDTLFIAGHEDRLCAIHYDEPEAWLRRGHRKGEVLEGLIHGSGIYCGRLFVRVAGRYRTAIDGDGALVLTEGDTLRNVVRLRTERFTRTIAQSLDSIANANGGVWREPPISKDSLAALINDSGPWTKSVICRYYAPGYRYPVLQAERIEADDGKSLNETARFLPPDIQEALASDPVSEARRAMEGNATPGDGDISPSGFAFKCSRDPDGQGVTVSCTSDRDVTVDLTLCDARGIVYRRDDGTAGPEASTILHISLAGLPRGEYVLHVSAGGEVHSEKVTVK